MRLGSLEAMDASVLGEASEDIDGLLQAGQSGLVDVSPAGRALLLDLYEGIEGRLAAGEEHA